MENIDGKNPDVGSESRRFDRNKNIILSLILLFLVTLLGVAFYFLMPKIVPEQNVVVEPREEEVDLFKDFSKLEIDFANARDNFRLVAEDLDSTGVAVDSSYTLKSKEEVDTKTIEKYLKIEPSVSYVLTEINKKEWNIKPQEKLEPNKQIRLSLETSYVNEQGEKEDKLYSWAYQTRDDFQVLHSIPRDQGVSVPVNSGIEVTLSHEGFGSYQDHFAISPAVEGQFEIHDRTLVFVPKDPLGYATIYTVSLKKGFGVADNLLKEDYVFSFETERQRDARDFNYFSLYTRSLETDTNTAPVIQIHTNNFASEFDVDLYKFANLDEYMEMSRKRDELPWWSYSKEDFLFDTSRLSKQASVELKPEKNDKGIYLILPEALAKGQYLVDISRGANRYQVLVQVSDLVVYTTLTKTDTLTWVNSSRTKSKVSGARVEILGLGDAFTTGADGVAVFKTPQEIVEKSDKSDSSGMYYLKISKDGDALVLPASRIYRSFRWFYPSQSDDYWLYLYTDRPRYQASDVVKFWGMIKDRDGSEIDKDLKLSLTKSGYMSYYHQPISIQEADIELSEGGTYKGEFVLENMKPGYYTMELTLGDEVIKTKYISIRPYEKPAYNLTLEVDKDKAYAGETINYSAKASFFEGTPVPNLELVFRDNNGSESQVKTDENGEAKLNVPTSYFECGDEYGCWPKFMNASVRPASSELSEITESAYVYLYGPDVHIRTEVDYPDEGVAELKINSYRHDLEKEDSYNWWENQSDDEIAQNVRIVAEVYRITYTKQEIGTYYDFINKTTHKQYRYEKNTEKVNELEFRTDASGQYQLRQAVEPETSYELKMKVYDDEGRYENYRSYFYYYNGRTTRSYNSYGYNYYHLKNKSEGPYSIGEEVAVQFVNGEELLADKDSSFLYMQLRDGYQEHALTGSSEYSFAFSPDDIPNINLLGVYFDGQTYVSSAYGYYGAHSFAYDTDDARLKILVESDKERYEPGEEVELEIEVLDKNDRPVVADVNLNLVDEAYYKIASDQATPLETLYTHIGTGILLAKSTHESLLEADKAMAEKGGCFVSGTKVLMADGSEKNIEDIKVGDKVKTFAGPLDYQLVEGTVAKTWEHTVDGYLLINDQLQVTPEHPMYSGNRFIDAGLLKVGDWLLNEDGQKEIIRKIKTVFKEVKVYNLNISPQNTYIAGGFYVHNQEKGGGPREFFTDAALFEVVTTDSSGRARTKFTLPDNITSWRVTAQAISRNIEAGVSVTKIPVSLPVFADVTIGDEYLVADKPVVRLRAYGSELEAGDEVKFGLESEEEVFDKQELGSQAFVETYYQLPSLKYGKYHNIYSLETEKGADAIKLPMDVVYSRMSVKDVSRQKLEVGTKVVAPNDKAFTMSLMDKGQSTLYSSIVHLSWQWGDRVDQRMTRRLARELLKKYYNQDYYQTPFVADTYQLDDGGVSLLPYSASEVELTTKIALSNPQAFDQEAMAQFFYNILDSDTKRREDTSMALAALVSMGKPVLPRVNIWLERDDLEAVEKLYLGLALAKIGYFEKARELYEEVMVTYAEKKEPHIIIKVSEDGDDVFRATAIASVLGAYLGEKEAEYMFKYLEEVQDLYGDYKNSEMLYNLEKYSYLEKRLEDLKPSPAIVRMRVFGEEKEINISGGKIHSLSLQPEQVDEIEFLEVEGDVELSLLYDVEARLSDIVPDDSIEIARKYFIDGREVDTFGENDLIQVRIYPKLKAGAFEGSYQITDYLPSGLAPVARMYYRGRSYDCHNWYPYDTDGQKVKFNISKYWRNNYCGGDYFSYYARVKNRGEYLAEPATIQAFANPDYINYSTKQTVKINE